jgi:predicted nicotinamide N-methyase
VGGGLPHGGCSLGESRQEEMNQPPALAPEPRLDLGDPDASRTFIATHTRVLTPPLVPEIRLHLAEESVPIWQKTEEELGQMNVPPPYWAFAWAGGQALARYILDTPDQVAGKSVLDLGSGSGLTAIAAAKAGAGSVLAAEIDRLALASVALNATLNGVSVATTGENLLVGLPSAFGVVMVGDLFYERELAAQVTAFIERAAADGATVLIGDPKRSYFPEGRFTRVAEYQVPVTRELEDAEIKRTSVWRLSAEANR